MHKVPWVLGDERSSDLLLFPELLLGELAVAVGNPAFHSFRQLRDLVLVPTPQDLIQLALAHVTPQHAAIPRNSLGVHPLHWVGIPAHNTTA